MRGKRGKIKKTREKKNFQVINPVLK